MFSFKEYLNEESSYPTTRARLNKLFNYYFYYYSALVILKNLTKNYSLNIKIIFMQRKPNWEKVARWWILKKEVSKRASILLKRQKLFSNSR